jgi:hypothetical protein
VASYCGPFSRLCGLGFDVVREFVGAGDASVAVGLDLVAVVDPAAAALAASGG